MVLDILTRTTGGDAVTRWNGSSPDASIALLGVYYQVESVAHEVSRPSRRVPQQQQLRPLLPTHTITVFNEQRTRLEINKSDREGGINHTKKIGMHVSD